MSPFLSQEPEWFINNLWNAYILKYWMILCKVLIGYTHSKYFDEEWKLFIWLINWYVSFIYEKTWMKRFEKFFLQILPFYLVAKFKRFLFCYHEHFYLTCFITYLSVQSYLLFLLSIHQYITCFWAFQSRCRQQITLYFEGVESKNLLTSIE